MRARIIIIVLVLLALFFAIKNLFPEWFQRVKKSLNIGQIGSNILAIDGILDLGGGDSDPQINETPYIPMTFTTEVTPPSWTDGFYAIRFAKIFVSGGIAPYSFDWYFKSNGLTELSFGLPANEKGYQYKVADRNLITKVLVTDSTGVSIDATIQVL